MNFSLCSMKSQAPGSLFATLNNVDIEISFQRNQIIISQLNILRFHLSRDENINDITQFSTSKILFLFDSTSCAKHKIKSQNFLPRKHKTRHKCSKAQWKREGNKNHESSASRGAFHTRYLVSLPLFCTFFYRQRTAGDQSSSFWYI